MQLTNPFIELGIRKGKEEGRFEGEVELVLRLLSRQLGALPMHQKKAIRKLDLKKIEALASISTVLRKTNAWAAEAIKRS